MSSASLCTHNDSLQEALRGLADTKKRTPSRGGFVLSEALNILQRTAAAAEIAEGKQEVGLAAVRGDAVAVAPARDARLDAARARIHCYLRENRWADSRSPESGKRAVEGERTVETRDGHIARLESRDHGAQQGLQGPIVAKDGCQYLTPRIHLRSKAGSGLRGGPGGGGGERERERTRKALTVRSKLTTEDAGRTGRSPCRAKENEIMLFIRREEE